MKKIWSWLLLLLLLIIFCVWSKKNSIHVTSKIDTQIITTPPAKTVKNYMDYSIIQKESSYILNGSFSNTQQQTSFSDIYVANSSHLTINDISIDTTLLGEEAIILTSKILPHFIKNYKNGKIIYSNNTLSVYGDVVNYEAKREMQALLNSSTLSTQNHTNVIKEKPINFSITKTLEKIELSGTFKTHAQGEILRTKLPVSTTTQINQAGNLIDNGVVAFTESILPVFIEKYKNGKIEYRDEVLSISGMVETKEALEAMNKILSSNALNIVNNTIVDQAAIERAAAEAVRKAQEVKLAAEARRFTEEKAKLEKEKKLSQIQVAKKEVKEKITKLLQIENIEFKVASGSLTQKGKMTVDKLANILSEYSKIKVEIAGHTDSDGSAIFNQKLSQKRVDTVRTRLIEKGIDAKRLTAIGYGESKPLVPNISDENKQKNRRVEINIQGE